MKRNLKQSQSDYYFKPSLSSLPLQMALFYNCLYSVIYAILSINVAVNKLKYYQHAFQLVAMLIWLIIEPMRLYYGISGNIRESVANLSTFILITIFPQLPLVLYMAYFLRLSYPIDPILGSFMFIFVVFQLYFAWQLIRLVIRNQTALFMRLIERDD